MNTYLYPAYDLVDGDVWISKVKARSLQDAKNKIMQSDEFESYDWDDYIAWLAQKQNIVLGDIEDIDEII